MHAASLASLASLWTTSLDTKAGRSRLASSRMHHNTLNTRPNKYNGHGASASAVQPESEPQKKAACQCTGTKHGRRQASISPR